MFKKLTFLFCILPFCCCAESLESQCLSDSKLAPLACLFSGENAFLLKDYEKAKRLWDYGRVYQKDTVHCGYKLATLYLWNYEELGISKESAQATAAAMLNDACNSGNGQACWFLTTGIVKDPTGGGDLDIILKAIKGCSRGYTDSCFVAYQAGFMRVK